jgi:hypothetical protein
MPVWEDAFFFGTGKVQFFTGVIVGALQGVVSVWLSQI